ncbi:hypothetical protein PI124_g22116 [Phytophthora idaei]|nr:hypothetical protein PI125_g14828 [Phytophthora idaei]KAG3127017.1 hypothetical protein PI126_g22062 [Phytophthora idaei]KAG3232805.1 hypothetical protein PI124_g22116 [Phytophthora idaei]
MTKGGINRAIDRAFKTPVPRRESLEAENRRLMATNNRVDAHLKTMKDSTSLHTHELTLAQSEATEQDAVINAQERQLAKEREASQVTVAASTEQTRQLHAILIKAQKGKVC